MFDVKEFVMRGIKKSFSEGSIHEGKARGLAKKYVNKGIFTKEDLERIESFIKEEQRKKQQVISDEEIDLGE